MKSLYTIRDVVAEQIGPIVAMGADPAAVRMFGDVISDPQSQVNRHPQDFELVCIGAVHDDGTLIADAVRVVITGAAWKAAHSAQEAANNVAQS